MTDPRVVERVTELGEDLGRDLATVTAAMHEEMSGRIPELRGDRVLLDLLTVSIRSNLETIVQVLRHVVDADEVATPVGAREYARRLAQHGVSPTALTRAYRLGHRMMLEWGFALISERETDSRLALDTFHALTDLTARYIDTISEKVVAEYQEERDRWLSHRSTVRADLLDRLIAGERLDVDGAEAGLGYRLRQEHLGVLMWAGDAAARGVEAGLLEHLANRLTRLAGGEGAPLFWLRDRSTGWAWIPTGGSADVPDPATVDAALAEVEPEVRVALGRPAPGLAGFRVTHLEATTAQQVALVAADRAPRVVSFGDAEVRAASLLTTDLERTRRLVASTLGPLAADTEHAARLRETVRVFIGEKGSYLAAAGRLHLHKNTVKYRVDKAMEERGRSVDEDRLDLELALIACRWLGGSVLAPAER